MKQLARIPRMAIFTLPGEIGENDRGKDGCGGRVRLTIRRPGCLVLTLVKAQKPRPALHLPGLESHSYPCPSVHHVWEGTFRPSSLGHIYQQRCCLFTRRNRAIRQASPSFWLNQCAPRRQTTQGVGIAGKLGTRERQMVSYTVCGLLLPPSLTQLIGA